MQIWSYLIPENKISVGIIVVQIGLFLLWCGILVYFLNRCKKYIKEIEACDNVETLHEYILNYFTDGSPETEETSKAVFNNYVDDKMPDDSPVRKHLWAIFQAGFHNTQFDSSALIKGTVGEAFKINNTLRSILSVFIILGLLGTLFGLSSSLAGLAPLSSDSLQDTAAIREILKNLLNELKSAFAPSVWGVGFTILGVLSFAYYYYRCNTFTSKLERSTLTNWVTNLILPPARTLMETIAKGDEQIRKNLEATSENIKNSERFRQTIEAVDSQTGAFQDNLRNANQTVVTFNESAGRLSQFSENFINAADKFAQYDARIEQLFQDIQRKSDEFQGRILNSFNVSQDFQNKVVETLRYQHKEITDITELLKKKDEADTKFRQETESQYFALVKQLDSVAGEAGKTFELLGTRNQEIVVALSNQIGEPLKNEVGERLNSVGAELNSVSEKVTQGLHSVTQNVNHGLNAVTQNVNEGLGAFTQNVGQALGTVSERLGEVTRELEARLTAVQNSMKGLSEPFQGVADQLSGTYSNFERGATRLVTDLHNDFVEQNRQSETKLNDIQKLNPQIAELLGKLSQLSEIQAGQNSTLAQNLNALTDNVSRLSQEVSNLTTTIQNTPRQSSAPIQVAVRPPVDDPPIGQPPRRRSRENGDRTESQPRYEPREYNPYEGSLQQQQDGILTRLKRMATFWRRK